VNRTIVREHIPKKCGNLEDPIKTDKVFDNTSNRIYGKRGFEQANTEASIIGSGYNPAEDLAKVGRKTLNSDQEVSPLFLINLDSRL